MCAGKLVHSEFDDKALDALKQFPFDGVQSVLQQFLESNLEHVSNKSGFLCGIMKTYRSVATNLHFDLPVAEYQILPAGKKSEL